MPLSQSQCFSLVLGKSEQESLVQFCQIRKKETRTNMFIEQKLTETFSVLRLFNSCFLSAEKVLLRWKLHHAGPIVPAFLTGAMCGGRSVIALHFIWSVVRLEELHRRTASPDANNLRRPQQLTVCWLLAAFAWLPAHVCLELLRCSSQLVGACSDSVDNESAVVLAWKVTRLPQALNLFL